MTAAAAGGERFLAAGEFLWMEDIARVLRARLGDAAANVPTRRLPTPVARALALFNPQLRSLRPMLGRENPLTTAKARTMLGFDPRPAAETIVDCARSFLDRA